MNASLSHGERMNKLVPMNALQQTPPLMDKKVWAKPALDILPIESAEHGVTGLSDGIHKQRSH